jgi:hypothetical protein
MSRLQTMVHSARKCLNAYVPWRLRRARGGSTRSNDAGGR